MPEYTVDITMEGAMRFHAANASDAKARLEQLMESGRLNAAQSNLGQWPDGTPILAELYIRDDWTLVDENGEEID